MPHTPKPQALSLGSAKGFSPRISAGYRINDLRFAVDYTRYKNYKQVPSTDFKLYSIGASAIYDFDTQSPVKPYLGARLSLNRASANLGGSDSFSQISTGLGVLAGVSYAVTPNVDLDAGYRYNYIGKVNNVKNVRTGELSAGVRVKF